MHSWKERVRIRQGDIAQADVEAVVNAANHELWMGSGVAGAIKRAGGAAIEREAVAQGPIAVGESVITTSGNLPSLHVIHAAAMAAGRPASFESVAAATTSALALAASQNIESIALPALGTGAGRVGLSDCAKAMLAAVREHCFSHAQPELIVFMLFGDNALKIFEDQFAVEDF
ncbi:macro domain-containing protein [bacterium]|nr:macro domain-containing protein [bacterium]